MPVVQIRTPRRSEEWELAAASTTGIVFCGSPASSFFKRDAVLVVDGFGSGALLQCLKQSTKMIPANDKAQRPIKKRRK